MNNPLHGEIWVVNLDPTVGQEIQKTRPAIVLSGTGTNNLPLRIVVPITGWKEETMVRRPWFVKLTPDDLNKLSKDSAAACHHLRSLSLERFVARLGRLSDEDLEEVKLALKLAMRLT